MTSPFLGEIRIVGFNFAPRNWAFCRGQIQAIQQNVALFSLLGTTYGGNGQTTFALPDLQSRAPIHFGQGPGLTDRFLGEQDGEEVVTLTVSEMPSHAHPALAGAPPTTGTPGPTVTWAPSTTPLYGGLLPGAPAKTATSRSVDPAALLLGGGGQPHSNLPPLLAMNYIICLAGVFPARN